MKTRPMSYYVSPLMYAAFLTALGLAWESEDIAGLHIVSNALTRSDTRFLALLAN